MGAIQRRPAAASRVAVSHTEQPIQMSAPCLGSPLHCSAVRVSPVYRWAEFAD